MRSFPKQLVLEAMQMEGVAVKEDDAGLRGTINHSVFNHSHYYILLRRIQVQLKHRVCVKPIRRCRVSCRTSCVARARICCYCERAQVAARAHR